MEDKVMGQNYRPEKKKVFPKGKQLLNANQLFFKKEN